MTLIYKPDFALNTKSNRWIKKDGETYANLSKKHVIETDYEYESNFIDDEKEYDSDNEDSDIEMLEYKLKPENEVIIINSQSQTEKTAVNITRQTNIYKENYELTIKKNNEPFQKVMWNNQNEQFTPIKNWKWNENNKSKKQRIY